MKLALEAGPRQSCPNGGSPPRQADILFFNIPSDQGRACQAHRCNLAAAGLYLKCIVMLIILCAARDRERRWVKIIVQRASRRVGRASGKINKKNSNLGAQNGTGTGKAKQREMIMQNGPDLSVAGQ